MKLEHATQVYLEYHGANSGKKIQSSRILPRLSKLLDSIGTDRHLDEISPEKILAFLNKITEGGKQQTKHGRYSHLKAFFQLYEGQL